MLTFEDYGSLLISAVSLIVAFRVKRRQDRMAQEIESTAEQVRSLTTRLNALSPRPDGMERVRHDLLTPISSVMGFCALLKATSDGWSPKQERMLENINAGAKQMLEFVSARSKPDLMAKKEN